MAYTKYEKNSWKTGDVVSSVKLNHMEDGIAAASEGGSSDLIRQGVDEDGNPVKGATVIGSEEEENVASGVCSHAEGSYTTASGDCSHAEGSHTIAAGDYQHVSGKNNVEDSAGEYAIIVGNGTANDKRSNAFAMKWDGTFVLPDADSADKKLEITPAEFKTMKNGGGGSNLIRQGVGADGNPVEGATIIGSEANVASGKYSHAEGSETTASNEASHAEGDCASAYGYASHAEGHDTNTYGYASHAEGYNTDAHGEYSHAEGDRTNASGKNSHAEGYYTKTSGKCSHAEGQYTIAARDYQHVSGKYNIEDTNGEYLVIVGNGTGTSPSKRSNAVAIKDDGSLVLAGGVTFTPADLQALYNLIHPTT